VANPGPPPSGGYLNGPTSVAIADLNGDGVMDLVMTNGHPVNTVSILVGVRHGTFASAMEYAVGANPLSVAIGDLNGDGVLDLATANAEDPTVSILFGNGDGTFASAVSINAGYFVTGVAIGDLNGDGTMDLATTSGPANLVGILLGVGHGEFGNPVMHASGWGYPYPVAIVDLNGDGVPDLVVGNIGDYTGLGILFGEGGGKFPHRPVTYGVGPYRIANSLAIADLNGDGVLDLATASSQSDQVSILLGSGSGTFANPMWYNVGNGPSSVALGDLNGDGVMDLATANMNDNTVSIMLGAGDGTFANPTAYGQQYAMSYGVGNAPAWIAIGDLNGDGIKDLVAANSRDNTVSVLLSPPPPPLTCGLWTFSHPWLHISSWSFCVNPCRVTLPSSFALTDSRYNGVYTLLGSWLPIFSPT
jgi:FG-GAP-like repeat/FG-GAP repeat